MMQTEEHDVTCRWLSGVETFLGKCATVGDVKIRASALTNHLATDIEILSTGDCVCLGDAVNAPDGTCIVIIKNLQYSTELALQALHMHASHGDIDGVERCIAVFDKRNACDSETRSPLEGDILALDELVWSACELACVLGEETGADTFRILYRYVQDTNRQDNFRMTLLHKALRIRWSDIVSILLDDPRIKVDLVGPGLRTALHTCVKQGHLDWMTKILKRFTENHTAEEVATFVNFPDISGCTALHDAASRECDAVLDALLLVPGIDVNVRTHLGWSPLAIAATHNCSIVAKLVRRTDIDLNSKDKDGRTALHVAIRRGKGAIVKELLQAGISVNETDNDQATALYDATIHGHLDIVDQLIAVEGININMRFADGRTPLMRAAFLRLDLVVDRLLSVDSIDVNLRDPSGNTASMLACSRGYTAVAHIIANREKL